MARRLGCLAAALVLVLGGAGAAVTWLVLSVTGVVASAPSGRLIAAAGLFAVVLAVGIALMALRRLAAPAGRLVRAARSIEEGDFSARVPVRGPNELRSLARAFNAMSGRLEADQARRRSVLADVAHELRTPLTVIRAQAEGVVDGIYTPDVEHMRPVLAATRTLEALVDGLGTLALAETGGLHLQHEAIGLGILVHETVTTFTDVAAAAGVRLVADVEPPDLVVDADGVRLASVLANLVANALRHVHRGGEIRISAAGEPGGVRVTVQDDGDGIPPHLLPRIFERFVKDGASPGSGLGLAIVRDIVEAHGGEVVATSTPALGTTVAFTLPGAGSSQPGMRWKDR